MDVQHMKTSYLVDNSTIITVKDENYFGIIYSKLNQCDSIEEFKEVMLNYPRVGYDIFRVVNDDEQNVPNSSGEDKKEVEKQAEGIVAEVLKGIDEIKDTIDYSGVNEG